MLGQEHPTLQEADQDYGRPAELGEGGMFEMEGRHFSEVGDGERQVPEFDGGGGGSIVRM